MLRNGRVKMAGVLGILVLIVTAGTVRADVGHGSPDVSTVTSIVHSVGELESTFDEFTAAIDRYTAEKSRCEKLVDPNEKAKCDALCKKLIEEAGDLLAKLNEQAERIESAVAVSKEKMAKDLSEKLDRVLERVVKVRQEASARMKTALARG